MKKPEKRLLLTQKIKTVKKNRRQSMKPEITIFIDEETMTLEELQEDDIYEESENKRV